MTINGPNNTPIVAIVGWKNSGKTTLTVRLVAELVRRGFRIATVKHAHHDFQIDDGEADSARHRRAGAHQVAVVSARRLAVIKELGAAPEPTLAEVVALLDPCDLIVAEGYKSAPVPKLEARRRGARSQEPLAPADPYVLAVAADYLTETHGRPFFALDDVAALADLIETKVMRRAAPALAPDEKG